MTEHNKHTMNTHMHPLLRQLCNTILCVVNMSGLMTGNTNVVTSG